MELLEGMRVDMDRNGHTGGDRDGAGGAVHLGGYGHAMLRLVVGRTGALYRCRGDGLTRGRGGRLVRETVKHGRDRAICGDDGWVRSRAAGNRWREAVGGQRRTQRILSGD